MPSEKLTTVEDFSGYKIRIRNEVRRIPQNLLDEVLAPGELETLLGDEDTLLENAADIYKRFVKKYEGDTSAEGKKYLALAKKKLAEIGTLVDKEIDLSEGKETDKPVSTKTKKKIEVPAPAPVAPTVDPDEEKRKKEEREKLEREVAEARERVRKEEEKEARYEMWLTIEFLRSKGVDDVAIEGMKPGERIAEAQKLGWTTSEEVAKLLEPELKKKDAEKRRQWFMAYEFLSRNPGLISEAEIAALPNADVAVQEAVRRSGKTMEQITAELQPVLDSEREAKKGKPHERPKTPTAWEVRRILGKKEDREKINAMLEQEDLPIITHENPDLDANAAIYILKVLGGAKNREIKYIPKGSKTREQGILLDVGSSEDLLRLSDGHLEVNHHYPDKWLKTSSAEIMLETLYRTGKIEKVEPWMREYVRFVSEIDNMAYARPEKGKEEEWFTNTYPNTLIGLHKVLSAETIAEFFKNNKKSGEPFTDAELMQKVTPVNGKFKDKEVSLAEVVQESQKRAIESLEGAKWHENRNIALGRKVFSNELGRVLYYEPVYRTVNRKKGAEEVEDHGIPLTAHAAYILGYDTFVRSELKSKKGYFISWPDRDLNPLRNRMKTKDPNAIIVRASMILNYPDKYKGTDGAHISEYQFLRYIGLNIPTAGETEIDVEYQTRRIVFSYEKKKNAYAQKLNAVSAIFTRSIERIEENIALMKASIEANKTKRGKEKQNGLLSKKIEVLEQEQALWEAKIAKVEELRGKPESEFRTLFDETKLSRKTGAPDEEVDEEGDIIDDSTLATSEKNVTAGPKPTVEKTPASEPASTETTSEKIEHIERETSVEKLKARYIAIERQLASPGPSNIVEARKEYRELMTEHYNIWAQYQWIKKGSAGTPPTPITFDELRPILQKEKGITPVPGTTFANSQEAQAETLEEMARKREEELDAFYNTMDIIPNEIDWGIQSKDASGNLVPGRAFIDMNGEDYYLEELEDSAPVKAKDPKALRLLAMLKSTQEKIDAINKKYAPKGKANPADLLA